MAGLDKENNLAPQRGNSATFEEIITLFKQSNDSALIAKAFVLEDLSGTMSDQNREQTELVLGKMRSNNGVYNYEEINQYIEELETILISKEDTTQQVTTETAAIVGGERGWLETGVEAVFDPMTFIFGPESLRKIRGIDLGGNIGTPEAFRTKMNTLINQIQTTPEFQALSSEEKNNTLSWFQGITDDTLKAQRTQLTAMNSMFDNLGKQIEQQNEDGSIELTLGKEIVSFETKEEAYQFVEMMKLQADEELETTWINIFEDIGDGLLFTLDTGWEILTSPYTAFEWIYDTGMGVNTGSSTVDWGISAVLVSLAGIMAWNYTETLWRRIFLDTLGKMGVNHPIGNRTVPFLREIMRDANGNPVKIPAVRDANGKIITKEKTQYRPIQLVIPDFNTSPDFYANGQNIDLRNEYLQRIQAVRIMEETLRGLSGRERDIFEAELTRVKGYLNVNTNTFWLRAWSLDKNHNFLMRGYNGLRGPIPANLRNKATQHFNLDDTRKEEFKKGLRYVFDGSIDIEVKEGKLVVTGATTESQNIKNVKNYILSQSGLSTEEKNRRIHRVDEFLEELRDSPAGEEYIKREVINIAREGYLSEDEILGQIGKKLEERHPSLKIKDRDLTVSQRLDKMFLRLKEGWGKYVPATLTAQDSMLYKFKDIVKNGGFEGTQEHLDEIFKKVDAGSLEISQLMRARPLGTLKDFALGFGNRYGITTPQLTDLIRHADEYTSDEMKQLLDAGKAATTARGKIEKIIGSGLELNGEMRNPLQATRNHIHFLVNNIDEVKLTAELDAYLKDVSEGKVFYSEIEFFRELNRIVNGFMPTYKLLDTLEKMSQADGVTDIQKANIGEFIKIAETGKLNFKQSDVSALKAGTLIFNPASGYIAGDFTDVERQGLINGLKDIERLGDYSFRDRLGIPAGEVYNLTRFQQTLIQEYRGELDQLKIIGEIQGTPSTIENELKKFATVLNHEYTVGQASTILERIFAGESFDTIAVDLPSITTDTTIVHSTEFNIKNRIQTQLVAEFERVKTDAIALERVLNYIIDNKIPQDTLPENIKLAIQQREGLATRNTEITRNISALTDFKNEIQYQDTPEKLTALETRFNAFLDNTGNNIDRSSTEYAPLVLDFRTTFDARKVSVEVAINRTRLEALFQEVSRARTAGGLERTNQKFDDFIASIDSTNSAYTDLIQEYQDIYDSKFTSLGGTPTVTPIIPPSPEPERAPDAGIESKEAVYARLKNLLDSIYPSVLMLNDPTAITRMNEEYTRLTNDESYRDGLSRNVNLLDYYKNIFGGRDIFQLNDLRVNLEAIRQRLAVIDPVFAGPRNYSQMGDMIRGTYTINNSEAILGALRELRLTR